ncbi:hypothetical protein G6F40_016044 [Rhizopus arrhizus]|nr:hypothetical protein G6F40_016044 [Rhizopus arrhizus]KAG1239204.1 hypothetical protein G6F68_018687 [Rhizopus microsporus]
MLVPGVLGGFVHAQRVLEVLQHAQVVQRVRVASNAQGQIAYPGAANGVGRQQRRLGMGFFQVFDDGERLPDDGVAIDQRGHQRRRVHIAIPLRQLLPAVLQQMHRQVFVGQALQVQGDAYAVRGRAAEIAVQLHEVSSMC